MGQDTTTVAPATPEGPRRRWRPPRAALLGLAAVGLVVVLLSVLVLVTGDERPGNEGATGSTTSEPVAAPRPDVAVLTPQGDDAYVATEEGRTLVVRTAPDNTEGNLRVVVTDRSAEASRDQQVCASWSGALTDGSQPGLALRVRSAGDTTRAITVTNNVFADIRWRWNVHTWDDGKGTLIGRANLFPAFDSVGLDALPWSMCARAVGNQVSFIAWPAGAEQPSWSDPGQSGHLTLPDGWDGPGVPGWYVGHLTPGGSTRYTDTAAWDLTPTDGAAPSPVWPPA